MHRTGTHQLTQVGRNLLMITVPTVLVLSLILELFFRFVIPVSNEPYKVYDTESGICRYDIENGPSRGIFAAGWASQLQCEWKLNNHGWNSDVDYVVGDRSKPLIAIIGDSFIEALQVPPDRNVAAFLRQKLHGRFDVYGFGFSQAALPAYLQISRYVARLYKPRIMVVTVVHNDFLAALCPHGAVPGFLCLKCTGAEVEEFLPALPPPSALQRLSRQITSSSALVRFVRIHLGKIEPARFLRKSDEYNGNIEVAKVRNHKTEIALAVDYCIRKMRDENPDTAVVVMTDARRQDIYAGRLEHSNISWLHDLLRQVCSKYAVHFLDLTDSFAERYKESGVRFESQWDYHWDREGHEAAADALVKKLADWGLIN